MLKIHDLNCGTFCPLGELAINGHGSPFKRGKLVCHCQLIETNDGLILIDTGLGTRDIARPKDVLPGPIWQFINQAQLDPEETAIYQIKKMGFKPEDVRHIVVTHLDFDHAGGLADFPHAQVHVYAREHIAATRRPLWRDRMRYAPAQFEHQPKWKLYRTEGEKWFGFDSVRALQIPGTQEEILIVPLMGHTPGHCGIAVSTEQGWILHCGDAAFYHGELDSPKRRCPPGLRIYQNVFQHDRALRLENQKCLRELVLNHGDEVSVFCAHDPEMMNRFAGKGISVHGELLQQLDLAI